MNVPYINACVYIEVALQMKRWDCGNIVIKDFLNLVEKQYINELDIIWAVCYSRLPNLAVLVFFFLSTHYFPRSPSSIWACINLI